MVEHISHSRTKLIQVLLCPSFIFIFTKRSTCPTVIRCTKNKNDIRTSQFIHTSYKGTVGIICFTISCITNSSSRKGIINTKPIIIFSDQLMPPSLTYRDNISLVSWKGIIPYTICIRLQITFKCGIGITQNRNGFFTLGKVETTAQGDYEQKYTELFHLSLITFYYFYQSKMELSVPPPSSLN